MKDSGYIDGDGSPFLSQKKPLRAKVENSVVKKLSLLILIISSEIHYSMFHCVSTAA